MKTIWGERLDTDRVLQEYPRPQLQRGSYLNLNGIWKYAITANDTEPVLYDGDILVPFSPESELSGVRRQLLPSETLWYRREVMLPEGFHQPQNRLLLHFGAVDQETRVFINGTEATCHRGGYLPFSMEIASYIEPGANGFTLKLLVHDSTDTSYHARGKQKTRRGGIWYTPQSGIWQTVWLESVPRIAVDSLKIEPLFDDSAVALTIISAADTDCTVSMEHEDGKTHTLRTNRREIIPMKNTMPWTPATPRLYTFSISLGDDVVTSYFAMRKFSVGVDAEGKRRLFLNNRPYFHNGVLDQGYWSDGLYTAPSDEAMVYDIQMMKQLGFNMLRKHIKIEPLRWYYHCDRLGMLVWQDMVNGGGRYSLLTISSPLITNIHFKDFRYRWFARQDAAGRQEFSEELTTMIRHLYNCPCIAMWVPFNEGWGQFDAEKAVAQIQSLDKSRTIDHASGWHDQKIGEFQSRHVYFKPYRFKKDKLGRAVILTEFGGYSYPVAGHCYNTKDFGYKKLPTPTKLFEQYRKLYEQRIIPAKARGLAATVYTQLSDVEDEVNGFLTYDRKVLKLPIAETREIVSRLND
ncbi:MAG: glycoside hydrolase family 2 TIM barrel-domain containing protein [Sphaerochaetaceae bacterium]|nr:glycoside hydrolase family 2 TIM barrel-domain containing protein [Sphaerochaetaceae bacterium]